MCAERATLRRKPEALQPAVEFHVHRTKRFEAVIEANPQHSGRAGWWKNAQSSQDQIEGLDEERRRDRAEQLSDALTRHVTDEPDGHVDVLGRNPFPGRSATQPHAQLIGRRDRGVTALRIKFNRDEQTHRL